MKIVDRQLLQQISEQARISPRLRNNHNFHPSDDSRSHRLLNAIEPNSYIRPHRHLDQEKDEAFILLSGKLGIVTFDETGKVSETALLSVETGNRAADIPHGVFHTALALTSGTVFYEAKAGPYRPLSEEEKACWAPEENSGESALYLIQLEQLFR
jgi:cupin fold WbuC family metalloprotein